MEIEAFLYTFQTTCEFEFGKVTQMVGSVLDIFLVFARKLAVQAASWGFGHFQGRKFYWSADVFFGARFW
jgi:hypothetical protein